MMNAKTGRSIGIADHINQSINDILWTKYGHRVQREEYGSLLPELIDQPSSEGLMLQISAAVFMALATWEPRIDVTNVSVSFETGEVTNTGVIITIKGLINGRAEEFTLRKSQHEPIN